MFLIFNNIIFKLRVAWEIHVCAVSISKNPPKTTFFFEFSPNMFFLSAGTYSHHAVSPIAEEVELRRYFGNLPCAKKLRFFGRAKAVAQKNSKKSDFFWESFGIHFVAFFFFVVMFFHCAFWVVHDFRRTVRKNGFFSCPEKMTFFRASKNAVFSGHGSRMTVRKNPGYLADWLSGWLADSLAALAGWLFGNWLRGWLAGYSAIRYLAGWLAACLALAI